MLAEIAADDVVARCLIYPRFFEGSIHVNGKLWEFGKRAADGASHESALLVRLLEGAADIHAAGCAIAEKANDRHGIKEDPDRRRYYCGYRLAEFGRMCTADEGYHVTLTISPEFGVDAHLDVALFIDASIPKNRQAVIRTNAGLALAEAFGPAEPYVCDCDKEDDNHPFKRYGDDCLTVGLLSPWQGRSVHQADLAVVSEIVGGGNWPGLARFEYQAENAETGPSSSADSA